MTYRPGTIKRVVDVNMAHPRDVSAPRFLELQRELTQLVMEEQMRHQCDERAEAAGEGHADA